jgi:hypothetical protein
VLSLIPIVSGRAPVPGVLERCHGTGYGPS